MSVETNCKIKLENAAQIERLKRGADNECAVYTFATMYLWQEAFKFSLYLTDEIYSIRCRAKSENAWFFPCGEDEACRRFISEHIDEPYFCLIGITEKNYEKLNLWFPGVFACTDERNSYEYVLDIDAHIELKGKAYRHVRNNWHRATREHELRLEPLTDELMDTVWQILREWKINHNEDSGEVVSDDAEVLFFNARKELNAELYVLYVDDEAFGVIGGYAINDEIFDLSIAKEKYHLPGVSYAAKRLLFSKLQGRFKYANLEDDLGLPGLRQMKNSLVPVRMNRMWSAVKL